MLTPATVASNTCSNSPANRDTSVEVPPMSNPMTGILLDAEEWPGDAGGGASLSYVVTAYPT